ncbi:MAG: serine/threonine-protein phosphatase [Clostridiales bacterium]|nr:serine/threonine-protein phosphatase [Clostridiales bacterium]
MGDSRVYLLRNEPAQLTRDQTFIQREVDEGRMTREAARRDSRRNLMLQCVGSSPYIETVFGSGNIFPGSMFLLCSDGFCHVITREEIFRHLEPSRLSDEAEMQERLRYLIALDKYRGEPDNISAVLIRCD